MNYPETDIEHILFGPYIDKELLIPTGFEISIYDGGEFKDINWLNTPGPVYTTFTDNCGTGQIAALNNIGGDEDYREVIFKQPFTHKELKEILVAAAIEPFGAYYFDGTQHWNKDNITEWWRKSEERVTYILERYKDELMLPEKPHVSSWKIGDKIFTGQLFGSERPVPENYKYWLDFYQFHMRAYLEWYLYKIHGCAIDLPVFNFDWSKRKQLDKLFFSKKYTS